jgi:mannose-6-phosphate isomerase-like protein (cupin superfamily)
MNQESINIVGQTYIRPWGTYKTLDMADGYQVKIITVNPGGRLSLQKHFKRSEHWTIVKGNPTVTVGNQVKQSLPDESFYIPVNTAHRMENLTKSEAIFIEVQLGEYLGEDDIERLSDIYERQP